MPWTTGFLGGALLILDRISTHSKEVESKSTSIDFVSAQLVILPIFVIYSAQCDATRPEEYGRIQDFASDVGHCEYDWSFRGYRRLGADYVKSPLSYVLRSPSSAPAHIHASC